MKTNIYIIGMSGSGKTTIGRSLAGRMQFKFLDTDEEIVRKTSLKIEDIFKEKGEEYFRLLEFRECKKASNLKNTIISTGGGVILDERNIKNLSKTGYCILLEGSIETLFKNLSSSSIERPLLKGEGNKIEKILNMWLNRKSLYYSAADFIVNVDNKSINQITDEIININIFGGIEDDTSR